MNTNKYFDLTDKAGEFFRSKRYNESLDCCYEIIKDVDSLKKQMHDFKSLNKDFISYTILNILKIGVNQIGKEIFEDICNTNIISKSILKEEIKSEIEFEIGFNMNSEILKNVINYFFEMKVLSKLDVKQYINDIEETLKEKEKYITDKEKITNIVLNQLKDGKTKQKEIYKLLPELDGRYILSFIKELEKENKIIRQKEGNDYFLNLV